jgi:aarF domain-containing kinase
MGLTRTIQLTKASFTLFQDIINNPKTYINQQTNMLSIPKLLRHLFESLGATYIKFGQFIASSPTLFPAEYVLEFQSCLDQTPTIPFIEIQSIIKSELKKPISQVYAYINPIPVARYDNVPLYCIILYYIIIIY